MFLEWDFFFLNEELTLLSMKTEKSCYLTSASWKSRKVNGINSSQSLKA